MKLQKIYFKKAKDVPNSFLPVLIFRGLLPQRASGKADTFRKVFRKNCWAGIWTDTIYDYTHFHSNSHEVLGIAEGKVSILFGGKHGRLCRLKAGDMIILPAGVGHQRVGPDDALKVIGAYPRGQSHYTMKRKGRAVPKVPLPETDPFFGEDGPVMEAWRKDTADFY